MRRYIKAFSKEEDGKEEKTDAPKGSHSGTPQLRHKNRGGFNNRRSLTGWQMIRHSALGLEFGNEELEDEQDIKYVWDETQPEPGDLDSSYSSITVQHVNMWRCEREVLTEACEKNLQDKDFM